jgi:hypothetical protein
MGKSIQDIVNKKMAKPTNEWAHELSGILGKAGYTVLEYSSINVPLRTDGKEPEDRSVVELRILPPKRLS